jgi:hypothetical protein
MRLKRSNVAPRVCVLVSFCVLVATAAMAVPALAALPEGRVYEMVSPPQKALGVAAHPMVGPGGESVLYESNGVFAGSPGGVIGSGYLARRGSTGWQTSPETPAPLQMAPGTFAALAYGYDPADVSPDLTLAITAFRLGSAESSPQVYFLHSPFAPDTAESLTPASPPLEGNKGAIYSTSSVDFGRRLFTSWGPLVSEDTLPEGPVRLYESTGSSPPSLKRVGGDLGCVTRPGGSYPNGSPTTAFHAVSADGSEVFFTACGQVYVWVNGSETVPISAGVALFQGANIEGSKVFYTEGGSLYEDEIEAGAVTGHVLVAEGVQGVTRISGDGSHIYFVSTEVLTSSKATLGAENLYGYDTLTRETKFVAELCSAKEASGSVTGVGQCPSSEGDEQLWQAPDNRPAQTNECVEAHPGCEAGRFLVFDTYAALIHSGPEADTDTAQDVYRYDFQTGQIVRVSTGEDGHHENGNGAFDATIAGPMFYHAELVEQYELENRTISESGSTVVFTTAEPLSSDAINGQPDHYVWHEGSGGARHVGLISSGTSTTPDYGEQLVITPSGRDIFFLTTASIAPQDFDGLPDVYDARIGGGFPAQASPAGCAGEACRGPLATPPAALLSAGSLTQPAGEQLASPAKPKSKPKAKPLTNAQKLSKALKACKKKPKRGRAVCEAQARRRYAGKSKAGKSTRGGK